MLQKNSPPRCQWVTQDPLYIEYHDHEWGIPEHDSQKLFELLLLEGAQAGLSWITILQKRENYRAAFDQFNPQLMAHYSDVKIKSLLANPGIIRNKLKVAAFIHNAKCYLEFQASGVDFSHFIWSFVDHTPRHNHRQSPADIPTQTVESEQLSKALKQHGFKFIGPTIAYAFMQASGMVNDHTVDCSHYNAA